MIYYPFAREEDDTPRKPQPKVKAEPEDDGYEAQAAPAQHANQAAPALEQLAPANDVSQGGNRAPPTAANTPNALDRATQLELAAAIAIIQMNQGQIPHSSGRVQVPTSSAAVTSAPHAPVQQPPVSSHLAHPMKTPEIAAPEDPAPQQANTLGNLNFGQFGVVQAAPAASNASFALAPPPENLGNLNFGAHGLAAPAAPTASVAPALPPANLGNLNFGTHGFAAPNVPMNAPPPPEFNHFHNFDQNPRFQSQPRVPQQPFLNQVPPQFGGFAAPNAHQMPHPAQQVVMIQQMNHLVGMMMNEDPQTTNLRLRMMHKDLLEHLVRDLLARFKVSEQQRHYTYGELVQRDRVIGRMRDEFNEDTLKKEQEIKKLHEENAKNDIEFVNLSVEAPRLRKANQDLEEQKLKWEDERRELNGEKLILSQQKSVAEREKNRIEAEKAKEILNLREDHAKKLNDVETRHQKEMKQMKDQIEAEKANGTQKLREDHAKELAGVKTSLQEEMRQMRNKNEEEKAKKIQELKEAHAKDLGDVGARNKEEMNHMKAGILAEKDTEIRNLKQDHSKSLAEVDARHKDEMELMKNKIETEKANVIQKIKDDHTKVLAEVIASHQEEMKKTKKKMEKDTQLQEEKEEKLLKDNVTLQTKINEMKNNGKGLIGLMTTLFNQDDDEPTTSNPMSATMEKFKEVLMEQAGQKRSSDNVTDQVKEKRAKMDDNADLE